MKKRIKIDSALLSFIIMLTGVLYLNKNFYSQGNVVADNVLDFLGFILILKGILFRMCARGYKKAHSKRSKSLVTSGPYSIVRNPMYLGSFLLGAGFVLMLWPWWSLPVFAWLFYLRFNKQVLKEEELLSNAFGQEYAAYCRKTARIFPSLKVLKKNNIKKIFNFNELFSTKEKRGLLGWPALAVVLESFQGMVVFGRADVFITVMIFINAAIVFFIISWILYERA